MVLAEIPPRVSKPSHDSADIGTRRIMPPIKPLQHGKKLPPYLRRRCRAHRCKPPQLLNPTMLQRRTRTPLTTTPPCHPHYSDRHRVQPWALIAPRQRSFLDQDRRRTRLRRSSISAPRSLASGTATGCVSSVPNLAVTPLSVSSPWDHPLRSHQTFPCTPGAQPTEPFP